MDIKDSVIIEAKNLKVKYKDKLIWSDASFNIQQGEFVGVLGPNGAGKTTLFKLLLGLIDQTDGSLKLFNSSPKKGNSRIGYVPQRRNIDKDMNVSAIELVKLGIDGGKWSWQETLSRKSKDKLALKTLEHVNAKDLAYQPLGILSGGELQRIYLAQALVGEPELLLLDEPLANLDIKNEYNLVQLISGIVKSKNISVLLIAHDLNPLLPVLDKVIYVARGNISSGSPSKIITSESLSKLFGSSVEVLKDSKGRVAILGIEESSHPHA